MKTLLAILLNVIDFNHEISKTPSLPQISVETFISVVNPERESIKV